MNHWKKRRQHVAAPDALVLVVVPLNYSHRILRSLTSASTILLCFPLNCCLVPVFHCCQYLYFPPLLLVPQTILQVLPLVFYPLICLALVFQCQNLYFPPLLLVPQNYYSSASTSTLSTDLPCSSIPLAVLMLPTSAPGEIILRPVACSPHHHTLLVYPDHLTAIYIQYIQCSVGGWHSSRWSRYVVPDSDTSHPVQLEVGVGGDTTLGSRDTLWQYGCIAVWQYGMDNILANIGWRIN